MELVNIMEQGLLIDYDEYEKLTEQKQENFFIYDDFVDCDYLKFKNKEIVKFISYNNKIFYIIVDYDFEIYENTIKEILLKFYSDDFKNDFFEVDTYNITDDEKQIYENTLNKNIVLFYRGGVGYYYGVHKLTNENLINLMDLKEI